MEFENQPQKRTFWEHLLKGIDEPIFKRGAYSFGKDITFALYPKIAKKKNNRKSLTSKVLVKGMGSTALV